MSQRMQAYSPQYQKAFASLDLQKQAYIERLEALVAKRLEKHPYRLEHVYSVAHHCGSLAEHYGVDFFEAVCAALLHDWDKLLRAQELIEDAQAYGFDPVDGFEASLPILHGWTASRRCKELFSELPQSVFDAIERHTLGDIELTRLDKLLYIVDNTEPTRTSEVQQALFALAGQLDLDELYLRCYRESLIYCLNKQRHLCSESIFVWNTLVAQRNGAGSDISEVRPLSKDASKKLQESCKKYDESLKKAHKKLAKLSAKLDKLEKEKKELLEKLAKKEAADKGGAKSVKGSKGSKNAKKKVCACKSTSQCKGRAGCKKKARKRARKAAKKS